MKIWALTKLGLKECFRQRVVYFIFCISLLFVLMAKGCDIGTVRGEGVFFGKDARQGIALGISFNGIVFWSIMLCGLLASLALTRDGDEGTAAIILARPISRTSYVAGRVLPALIIPALNLIGLGLLFCWFFYHETGAIQLHQPLSFLFMTVSLGLFCLMVCCLSLIMPRLLAPLVGMVVYVLSCWSSLPYYFENLKLLWTPSPTIQRMHLLLPRFGDLQCIGASLLNSQPLARDISLPEVAISTAVYGFLFWASSVWLFKKREF